ncbi:Spindle assembly abnormal protein 6 homolog [Trichuris trichiura]|uniref:Spindle assembly abnormal protein 6 homolog n=1 Tax=Trichuris trichiura TaxID=36087 RepID=A0A077Z853_TRITR|nr:Spindle assembly abnormal protein 6 homolog [Trichuris trichiura]
MNDKAVKNAAILPNESTDIPLYAKKLPVSFVQNGQKLKAYVNFKLSKALLPTAENLLQKLSVKVTREDDPLLLLTTTILQEDYYRMKESQSLLVDFQSFPQKLIDLLELVLFEATKMEPRFAIEVQISSSKTGELAKENTARLEVVEVNRFRRLTHLYIELQSAATEQLQEHLCSLVVGLTRERTDLQKQIFQLDEELKKEKKKEEENVKLQELQLDSLRKRFSKTVAELREEHEKEKTKLENTVAKIKQDLQAESDQLQTSMSELKVAQIKCASINSENNKLRQEIDDANREVVEAEKVINQLQTRLCGAEQELLEKESALLENEERLQHLLANLRRLEDTIEKQAAIISQLQAKYADQVDETQKGIHILRRFKEEITETNRKASLRAQIAVQQEKKVEQYEVELNRMRKKMESLQDENNQLADKINRKTNEVVELTKSLDDVKAQLEGKEKIICYLNKSMKCQQPMQTLDTMPCDITYKPVLRVASTENGSETGRIGLTMAADGSCSKLDPKYLVPNLLPLPSNLHKADQSSQISKITDLRH